MATKVRRDPSRFGKPKDTRSRNAAITSMVAEGAHGQHLDRLRRTERRLGRQARLAGSGLEGSVDAVDRYGKATAGQGEALQRQQATLRELQRRQEQAVKRSTPDFHERFPGYGDLDRKTQEKRWRNWQKGLAESISLRNATKAYEDAYKRYTGRAVQATRLMESYRKSRSRATRLQRKYVMANRRLRSASRVARWTP